MTDCGLDRFSFLPLFGVNKLLVFLTNRSREGREEPPKIKIRLPASTASEIQTTLRKVCLHSTLCSYIWDLFLRLYSQKRDH